MPDGSRRFATHCCAAWFAIGAAAAPPSSAAQFVAQQLGLRAADVAAAAARRAPLARTLDGDDNREVAALGAIHMNVPAAFYVEQLERVDTFKRSDDVLAIGAFSTPARVEDVADLALAPSDLKALRRCRVGRCGVQLPAEALRRVATAAPSEAALNQLFREWLVGMVNEYRDGGDAALPTYADTERPVSVALEFRALIAAPPAMLSRFPSLLKHVTTGLGRPDGGQDVIYWSKERVGPSIVISVTHLAIMPVADRPPVSFAAASKQLFATHYFDTSLGLTMLIDDPDQPGSAYLAYVSRSRIDVLGGFWGGVKRRLVRSRLRGVIERTLVAARNTAEARFVDGQEAP